MQDIKRILKFMLIFFGIIGGIIGILILVQFIFDTQGPFGEYMLYRKARDYSYYAKDYVEKYPRGKYFKEIELSYSHDMFTEAENMAKDTTYLNINDKCLKIFDFIRNFKNSPEYPEALKIAEEYGYNNYKQLKDWARIYNYMEVFPNGKYIKEFTLIKDKSIDSALVKLDLMLQSNALNKNQAKLLKYVLENSKKKAQQLALCLKILPEISIADQKKYSEFSWDGKPVKRSVFKDSEFYFAEFSESYMKMQISKKIFESFSTFLPGTNFFRFDTLLVENLPILEIKCKVYNLFTSANKPVQTPQISQFYYEKHLTKTTTTTKRVSEYNRVLKTWEYKDVTESKSEIDYSKPVTYDPGGFYFNLGFDFQLDLNMPESTEQLMTFYNYKSDYGDDASGKKLENVYQKMTDNAINGFVQTILPARF